MLKHQFPITIHGAIVYLPAKNTSRNQPNVGKYISPMDGMSLVFLHHFVFLFWGGGGWGILCLFFQPRQQWLPERSTTRTRERRGISGHLAMLVTFLACFFCQPKGGPPNATFSPRNSRPYDQGLLTIGFPYIRALFFGEKRDVGGSP